MNLYEKIADARIQFQQMNVKKTGKNKFAGYTYFTLDEILPAINVVAKAMKFVCIFGTTDKTATLTIVDTEKPEDKVTFSCAYVRTITKTFDYEKNGHDLNEETMDRQGASLKGCHPVQNEGATITYLKRYLYLNAFEISEGDVLDETMNPNEGEAKATQRIAQSKQEQKKEKRPFAQVMACYPQDKVMKVLGEFGCDCVDDVPEEKRKDFYNRVREL